MSFCLNVKFQKEIYFKPHDSADFCFVHQLFHCFTADKTAKNVPDSQRNMIFFNFYKNIFKEMFGLQGSALSRQHVLVHE